LIWGFENFKQAYTIRRVFASDDDKSPWTGEPQKISVLHSGVMTQSLLQCCFTCFPESPNWLTFILLHVFRGVTAAAINTAFRFHAIAEKSNMYETVCYYTPTSKEEKKEWEETHSIK